MKKLIGISVLLFAFVVSIYSQGHEVRVGINSGYAFFRGDNSGSTSFVNAAGTDYVYTNSPMGKKLVASYGLSADYRYVFRNHFLLGTEIGYENLRTKVDLDAYYITSEPIATNGATILNNRSLIIHPFGGYRLGLGLFSLDLSVGLDIAPILSIKESAHYNDENGMEVKFKEDRESYIDLDFRPRFQLNLNYKNYTFLCGASFGLANYYKDWTGGRPEAYLNVVRIGVQYKVW